MRRVVVDASVGVKWFKEETGSEDAWGLLEQHGRFEIEMHIPNQCAGEVLAVVARSDGPAGSVQAWVALDMAGVHRHDLDDALMREARRQMETLGCDLYDALAPALASLLDAQLVSADRRAHGRYPEVHLL
ncbi:MAG: PIN domain-containing protein [Actinomycetota bacterium]|nr:PIN domain-containing protein [Actinomycetota bacterium]